MRSLDYLGQFPFDALCEKTPASQALARRLVTESDLLRLKVIARLHARGLPPQLPWTDLALERLLAALERELLEATDAEILAAARELGMDPTMNGSSALFGVTLLVQWPSARHDVEVPDWPTHTARSPDRKL